MSERTQTTGNHSSVGGDEAYLQVRNLQTYYDQGSLLRDSVVKAVDGVSFDIREGETLGLVGESGCGKTTLGRTLIQLEDSTGGEVLVDGQDVTSLTGEDLDAWRQDSQIVFQDPESSLNERMTVGEIIREPLDVHDWKTPPDRRKRVRDLLETVGLREEHYYRYPHQFSGGQRQRIGIARALAPEPEFVVLDEPVSALDVSVQAQILNLLNELQDEFGLTYLFIAHDLSVVRYICDRVAVMYLGNIMELAPTEEVFAEPENPYTNSLLSAIPEPDPDVESDRVTLRGTPPSPTDPPQGCPFTTRCPMKIKPEPYDDLNDDVWEAIEVFQDVLRQRSRAERSLSEWVQDFIGMETDDSTLEEIRTELFRDLDVPASVATHIDEATSIAASDDATAAREYLREEFGSVCDKEDPEHHSTDSNRWSKCHRHREEYRSPRQTEVYREHEW